MLFEQLVRSNHRLFVQSGNSHHTVKNKMVRIFSIKIFILICLSFSIIQSRDFNEYKNGVINRTITNISRVQMQWIRQHCGVKKETSDTKREIGFKIYGGDTTMDFQYPWAVGIDIKLIIYCGSTNVMCGTLVGTCSGSLITKKHVLTCQHCFAHRWKKRIQDNEIKRLYDHETAFKAKITVGKGNQNRNYRHETEESSRYVPKANYYSDVTQFQHDWALVELTKPVPQWLINMKAIVPVCLPARNQSLDPLDQVEMYGQGGIQASGPSTGSGIMRYISTTINRTEIYSSAIPRSRLKIFSIAEIARNGDSGGGVTKSAQFSHNPITGRVLPKKQCKHILVGITQGSYHHKTVAVDVRTITDDVQNLTGIAMNYYTPRKLEENTINKKKMEKSHF